MLANGERSAASSVAGISNATSCCTIGEYREHGINYDGGLVPSKTICARPGAGDGRPWWWWRLVVEVHNAQHHRASGGFENSMRVL